MCVLHKLISERGFVAISTHAILSGVYRLACQEHILALNY